MDPIRYFPEGSEAVTGTAAPPSADLGTTRYVKKSVMTKAASGNGKEAAATAQPRKDGPAARAPPIHLELHPPSRTLSWSAPRTHGSPQTWHSDSYNTSGINGCHVSDLYTGINGWTSCAWNSDWRKAGRVEYTHVTCRRTARLQLYDGVED